MPHFVQTFGTHGGVCSVSVACADASGYIGKSAWYYNKKCFSSYNLRDYNDFYMAP